jgi:RNA polymerase sigma-70 factor (ECF subfamily)
VQAYSYVEPVTRLEAQLKSLMQRSLAGDAAAHREFLTVLVAPVRAYFRNRMRDYDADVEDLVQETLLAIHLKRETFDVSGLATAWVFAIARHKLTDWYRRRRAQPTERLDDGAPLFIDDDKEDATAPADVARLLDELSSNQAMAIRCMKLEELTAVETAARMDQSVAAVKVEVHRGLRKLMNRVRELLS